jgi:hypothetical protein
VRAARGIGRPANTVARTAEDRTTSPATAVPSTGISLLVRLWLEPTDAAHEGSVVRGYVRNLLDGRELYFDGLDELPSSLRDQDWAGEGQPASSRQPGELTGHELSPKGERDKGHESGVRPAEATTKEE